MRLIIFFTFTLFSISTNAQLKAYAPAKALIAIKKQRHYEFYIRTPLRITYLQNGILNNSKGILTSITNEGIYLSSFKKNDTALTYIPVNSISSITTLLRKTRKESLIVMGASLLIGGSLLIISHPKNVGTNILEILGIITVIVGAEIPPIIIAGTYLVEYINRKSVKRGWHFTII